MNLNLPESHRVWPGLNQSGSNVTASGSDFLDPGGSSGSSYHSAKMVNNNSYPVPNLTAVDSTSLSTLTTALSHCSSSSTVKDSRYALARRLKRLLSDMSDCLLAIFRRIYHRGHRRCESASEDGSELVIPYRPGGDAKLSRKAVGGANRHRRHFDSENNSPLGSYETARSFGDVVILTNSADWTTRSRVLICPPADNSQTADEILSPAGICDLKPPPANYKRLKSRQRSSVLSVSGHKQTKKHQKIGHFGYETAERRAVANLFDNNSRRSRKPKLGGDGKENLTADGVKLDGRRHGSSGSTNSSNSSSLQKSRSWDFSVCDTIGDGEFGLLVQMPPRLDFQEWLASHTLSLFNHINLLYGSVSEFCNVDVCPVMVGPGNVQYPWVDDKGKKTKCTAPQYIDYVMSFISKTVRSEESFPTKYGHQFPERFESLVKRICRLLGHVLVHLYMSHWTQLAQLGLGGHASAVGLHYVNFVTQFALVEPKELASLTELSNKFRRPQQPLKTSTAVDSGVGLMVDGQQQQLNLAEASQPANDFDMILGETSRSSDADVILQQPQSIASSLLSPLENVASLKELSQLDGFNHSQMVDTTAASDNRTDQV